MPSDAPSAPVTAAFLDYQGWLYRRQKENIYKKTPAFLDKPEILSILTIVELLGGILLVLRTVLMVDKSKNQYKTKDICRLFDISRATLFRWETEGLISNVGRDWRNWRLYSERNIKEIKKIIYVRSDKNSQ